MADYGDQSGHMRAGIGWRVDGYDTYTTSINVYVDFYALSVGWGYNSDTQTMSVWGSVSGSIDYVMSSPTGGSVEKYVGTLTIGGQGQNYGGGPSYGVGCQISGAYDGSSPSYVGYFGLPARPPNTPLPPGVGVDSVGVNSARVVVTAPSDSRGAGVDWYGAWLTTNNAPPGGGGSVIASAEGGSFAVGGLTATTTYYAWAQARNAVGYSAIAGPAVFSTSGAVPAQVAAATISSVTEVGASLSWTAPSNGGSAISRYDIQVADDGGISVGLQSYVSTSTSIVYAGGGTGTRKYFRIRAVNGVGVGPWSTAQTFTTVQQVPTIAAPTSGQTLSTGAATATITVAGLRTSRLLRVQWNKDSSFASGSIEATVSPVSAAPSNLYTPSNPTAYLGGGTWYIRARVENSDTGVTTAWASVVSFVQTHLPVATAQTPSGGSFLGYQSTTPFVLSATDPAPADSFVAYQIIVERSDTSVVVLDTGKVLLAFAASAPQIVNLAIPSAVKDIQLRWRARVWDKNDTAGSYSANSLFLLVDAPVVAITAPSSPVNIGSPTVTWTFAATSSRTQARADVTITQQDTGYVAWSDFTTVATARSLTPSTTVLQNNKTYLVTVKVTDSAGLQSSATSTFTSSYATPAIISYDISSPDINTLGYTITDWSNAIADPDLAAWRVYRQEVEIGTWTMIAEYTDSSVKSHKDFLVRSGGNYLYNVTQVANRFGEVLESPVGLTLKTVVAPVRTNLVKNPGSESITSLAAVTNSSVARVVASTMRGTSFSQITATATGDAVASTPSGTAGAAVVAGTSYVASVRIRRSTGVTLSTGLQIMWYTSSGTAISTLPASVAGVADSGTEIETRWVTAVAPTTAAFAAVKITALSASVGQKFDVDDVLLEVGNTPRAYFDGSISPDVLNFSAAWSGTANASTSVLTEIPYTAESRIIDVEIEYYWIVVPDVPELSVALPGVTGDPRTLEFEEATYNIIGRGRHRDYGDRLGYSGTLSISVRGTGVAANLYRKVEELREAQETYWLRTPYGKLFPIALGNIGWTPLAGVGKTEMGDLSIPYEEVS